MIMKTICKIVKLYWKIRAFRYIVNLNTKEIHDINNLKSNCNVCEIVDSVMIRKSELAVWLNSGFNRCGWCVSSYDK